MSETSTKKVTLTDEGKPIETIVYEQWKEYHDNFLVPGKIVEALQETRRFFEGDQYAKGYATNSPKPTLNLIQEGVTKISAKIAGTKRHITFVSDKDDESLNKLDDFYEYQNRKMKRDLRTSDATMVSLIDGTAVTFTAFDADTIGSEGLYKGFLKDALIPFEETFWSNPWTDDPQDQKYLGYYLDMDVGAVKTFIEGDEATKKRKAKYIVKENFFSGPAPYDFDKVTDSDLSRVYVRFFRDGGEVYFELATQYVTLTDHPHALNPSVTEDAIAKKEYDFVKQLKDGLVDSDKSTRVDDISTDPNKYVMFSDPESQDHTGFMEDKNKFNRYPVSLNTPLPKIPHKCILGRSFAAMIIPNQKLYNYCYVLVSLIMQYHAMPKWLTKPNALGTQQIDNSPNQVLIDYSTLQETGGNGFGITRLSNGDSINSQIISIGDNIAQQTRFIFGFANLEADNIGSDTSGYAYSQMIKQVNLPLEIMQQHVWDYCGELAKNDLMYYKHYIDSAKFYRVRSDSDLNLNENYRDMEQNFINTGKSTQFKPGTVLPKSRRFEVQSIEQGFFDSEFDVAVEVEQGIAGSELTESQHYNQIWQYIAQGNLTADKIKMLIEGDPAISRKTRAKTINALEELETSQLAQKDEQIKQLQQAVSELQSYMKFSQQVIKHQQAKQKATEQASADQTKVAAEMIKSSQQGQNFQMSESEVKSNNAKGISGSSFSKGGSETIYNTGS